MLESLINPKRAEKGPWKMLFIGIIYASLSLILVHFLFRGDKILSQYSGLIVVTFCVMFSLPFMYFLLKREEKEDEQAEGFFEVWKTHKDAIYGFLFLFLGFIIAFTFWNIVLQNSSLFNAQVETYCMINNPTAIENCIQEYGITGQAIQATGSSIKELRFLSILENNIYVMIFTLIFSLIFGAGAIFILAWNASVIAAAIGIFTKYQIKQIPIGLGRYMIHGFPEISAYFITALAGGMFGIGILRQSSNKQKFLRIMENTFLLLLLAIIILIIAALIEVYVTPLIF